MKGTAIFVAGGTGGHLYPGIAAARAVAKRGWQVVFAVRKGDLGKGLLEREGFSIIELPGQGLPRRPSIKILTFPWKLASGFVQACREVARLKPDIVIGMGGYLSFPVLLAARLQGVRTLIHEQNVIPGLANRALSRWVGSVAVSFPESETHFPSQKVWFSGLPVRPEIGTMSAAEGRRRFNLAEDKLTFLIFGGSLGAHRLNEAAVGAWPRLSDLANDFQVLHVTGERDHAAIRQAYEGLAVSHNVMPYCHDMAAALGAADFVVCRSGASTIAELLIARKPALLVPFPFASENHQFYNAEVLVNRGVADLLPDNEVDAATLAARFRAFIKDPGRLKAMQQRFSDGPRETAHAAAAQRLAGFITGEI